MLELKLIGGQKVSLALEDIALVQKTDQDGLLVTFKGPQMTFESCPELLEMIPLDNGASNENSVSGLSAINSVIQGRQDAMSVFLKVIGDSVLQIQSAMPALLEAVKALPNADALVSEVLLKINQADPVKVLPSSAAPAPSEAPVPSPA